MGPTRVLSAPDGPHVGPMNLVIKEVITWINDEQELWCHRSQSVRTREINYIHIMAWDVIFHLCYNFNGCLTKPTLNAEYVGSYILHKTTECYCLLVPLSKNSVCYLKRPWYCICTVVSIRYSPQERYITIQTFHNVTPKQHPIHQNTCVLFCNVTTEQHSI